jgi:short-subunit dehydrogenase
MPGNIVVTGASSGIGRALAIEYAAQGTTLGLIGRNQDRLGEAAERARKKGAKVKTAALDVRDAEGLRAFLLAFDADAPVDCLIANAGVTSVTKAGGEPEDLSRSKELFDINIGGVMNTIAPLAPLMRQRRVGQIAIVSSIAAFVAHPDAASYCASKAALVAFGLATRALYEADGVSVSVICPGFVDTPLDASYNAAKPGLMSAEQAARRIRAGLARRKAVIAFPLFLYFLARAQQSLPLSLQGPLLMAFRAKQKR